MGGKARPRRFTFADVAATDLRWSASDVAWAFGDRRSTTARQIVDKLYVHSAVQLLVALLPERGRRVFACWCLEQVRDLFPHPVCGRVVRAVWDRVRGVEPDPGLADEVLVAANAAVDARGPLYAGYAAVDARGPLYAGYAGWLASDYPTDWEPIAAYLRASVAERVLQATKQCLADQPSWVVASFIAEAVSYGALLDGGPGDYADRVAESYCAADAFWRNCADKLVQLHEGRAVG